MSQSVGKHLRAELLYDHIQKIVLEVFTDTADHSNRYRKENYIHNTKSEIWLTIFSYLSSISPKELRLAHCMICMIPVLHFTGKVYQLTKKDGVSQGK